MMSGALPPGQHERPRLERFGLGWFANKLGFEHGTLKLRIDGDVMQPGELTSLAALPRTTQRSDFHCVTTWSVRDLNWAGVRFADFHAHCTSHHGVSPDATLVVLHGLDGYRNALPLADLLATDVLLADALAGEALPLAHGAPLRLVAPAHYGYKNVKHLTRIEYLRDARGYRFAFPYPQFMDHPRARVALEERARGWPAWLLRPFYRLLAPLARWRSRRALDRHVDD